MLIEFHTLTSHSPANLNRDDLGRPKSAIFGGTQRARISSQSIKRSIRTSNYLEELMRDKLSTRSRRIPETIHKELASEYNGDSAAAERLEALCSAFTEVLGKPDKNPLHTKQIVFLTPQEIERAKNWIRELMKAAGKPGKKELEAIKAGGAEAIGLNRNPGDGIDMALFGRMTTDDANVFTNVDASMQVAHAISTHTVVPEVDWFTAVDDIVTGESETGSGHLGEVEFNSAVFYKYFSCNLPLFVQNLNGAEDDALEALATVLDASCRVTPSGKQNSFASHALADTALLVIRRQRIPVSLANAFERPVGRASREESTGYLDESRKRLATHYAELVKSYNLDDTAFLFTTSSASREMLEKELPENTHVVSSLREVFDKMKEHVRGSAS